MASPWYLLLLVALVGAHECPDGSMCSDDKRCCSLNDGDGYDCCPQNEGATHALPMITDISCIKEMGCPDEYSCVKTPRGDSACCPLAQGTSCHDGHHCCPSGTYCSEDGHSCLPAINQSAILCPDGSSECPSGSTCCQMADQSWGCCPLEQAICCSDHVHCCPHNTMCDLVHSTCVSGDKVVPMSKKLPARMKLQASVEDRRVKCGDGSSCPDGSTCCELNDKTFGCCPLISAVCCGDHLHCCPSGTTCDLSHKKCASADSETPMFTKIPALREEDTVRCDATTSCPGLTTCCRLSSGEWGCCPYEQAVCCPDKIHCCPSGYTCSGGSCERNQDSIPWLKKMPALKEDGQLKGTSVPCDPTHYCPDKTTCCRLSSGQWGCCPIEQAVCCSDHLHCCPSGYTCDVGTGTCNKPTDELAIPATVDEPVTPVTPVDYVWCDGTHACYDGQTCCVGLGGQWSCCPYSHGVCCPDRLHCCPFGHVCLYSGAQCSRSGKPQWDLGWIKKKQPTL
ncbi:progranulin [Mantella aurantiaca]